MKLTPPCSDTTVHVACSSHLFTHGRVQALVCASAADSVRYEVDLGFLDGVTGVVKLYGID